MGVSLLTGATEKAVLVIQDLRQVADAAQNKNDSRTMSALQALLNPKDTVPASPAAQQKKMFTVQFNPAALTLFSEGETHAVSTVTSGGPSGTQNIPQSAQSAVLTVPLVFDNTNNADAFMFDKLNTSLSSVGKGIGAAVSQKNYSVRPVVEGLLATVKNPLTCGVQFAWGNFLFEGSIGALTVDYTMFSVSGEPIRATVSLKITQTVSPQTIRSFSDDFTAAFGGAGLSASVSGAGISGKTGGLFGGISGF